jgi:hypothetical protein
VYAVDGRVIAEFDPLLDRAARAGVPAQHRPPAARASVRPFRRRAVGPHPPRAADRSTGRPVLARDAPTRGCLPAVAGHLVLMPARYRSAHVHGAVAFPAR